MKTKALSADIKAAIENMGGIPKRFNEPVDVGPTKFVSSFDIGGGYTFLTECGEYEWLGTGRRYRVAVLNPKGTVMGFPATGGGWEYMDLEDTVADYFDMAKSMAKKFGGFKECC